MPAVPSILERGMNLVDTQRARICRASITPPNPRVIIGTNLSKFCYFGLNQRPVEGESRAYNNNYGTTAPRAIEVNSIATYIYELTWRRGRLLIRTGFLRHGHDWKYEKKEDGDGEAPAVHQFRRCIHELLLAGV
jgi:hypothetical protein